MSCKADSNQKDLEEYPNRMIEGSPKHKSREATYIPCSASSGDNSSIEQTKKEKPEENDE